MTKAALFGCLMLTLSTPFSIAAQQVPERDLTGTYECEGKNPGGSAYSGLVDIVRLEDMFLVRWRLPEQPQVVGIGLLNGDVLSVSYFGGSPSIVVYTVTSDGRLNGKWTAGATLGAVFTETLSKVKAADSKPAQPVKPSKIVSGVRGKPAL